MGLEAKIYGNSGSGPIDETTPIATVAASGLPEDEWETPVLAAPSENLFLVRWRDTVSGLVDRNRDAVRRIVIDAAGNDVSGLPAPPGFVFARQHGDGIQVIWSWSPLTGHGTPDGFDIWCSPGAVVVWADPPDATAPFGPATLPEGNGALRSALVTGLANGPYAVGVRAFNGDGTEANTTAVALVTIDTTAPAAPESPTSGPTFAAPTP